MLYCDVRDFTMAYDDGRTVHSGNTKGHLDEGPCFSLHHRMQLVRDEKWGGT